MQDFVIIWTKISLSMTHTSQIHTDDFADDVLTVISLLVPVLIFFFYLETNSKNLVYFN